MDKIDSHQHFWKFDPMRDTWITAEMSIIQKDFLPKDLEIHLKENGIDGCIAVQADASENENDFLLSLAKKNSFIKGIVGWLDFAKENLSEKLENYSKQTNIKGFRYILQGNPKRDLMLTSQFLQNIALLSVYGFSYDILVFPDQLVYVEELVKLFPKQNFVLDHLAKPYIKDKKISEWKTDMEILGKYSNVFCKLSGMVTEADWKNWRIDDFLPYLDVVTNSFGTGRIMFGSDWPVSNVAGNYTSILNIVERYFENYSEYDKALIFGGNASVFYRI